MEAKIGYYVDPINIIIHNEWDKFNDWRIPEKRWRTEAQLVNDDKAIATYSSRAYLYKLVYGVLIHAFALPIRMLLRAAPVKSNYLRFYFKLFDVYSTAIFWHQIKWRTIQRLQAQ